MIRTPPRRTLRSRRAPPARRGRGWARALLAALLLATTATATAFEPVVGTELLLADAAGRTLVGYGQIHEDGLRLELSAPTFEMRVVAVGPDGRAESYRGFLRDGRLELVRDGRPSVDVANALAYDDRVLMLALPDEEVRVPPLSETTTVSAETPDEPSEAVAEGEADDARSRDGATAATPSRSDDEPSAAAAEGSGRAARTAGRAGEPDDAETPSDGRNEAAGRPGPAAEEPERANETRDPSPTAPAAPEEPVEEPSPEPEEDAPAERSGDAPGRSGDAPGRSGDAPGRSGDAPGRSGDAPGRSGDAPGRSGRGGSPVRDTVEEVGEAVEDAAEDVIDLIDLAGGDE